MNDPDALLLREHHAVVMTQTALSAHDCIIREEERLRIAAEIHGFMCRNGAALSIEMLRDLWVIVIARPMERDSDPDYPRADQEAREACHDGMVPE